MYVFSNDYGVHSHLITGLYEAVEVNEIGTLPVSVVFSRTGPLGESFSLTPKRVHSSFETDVQKVVTIFQQWEKLGSVLKAYEGDPMRSTISQSTVKELRSGSFMFTIAETETIHIVTPARSSSIHVAVERDRAVVTLFNAKFGCVFGVTDGGETAEDVIDRFAMQTTRLQ